MSSNRVRPPNSGATRNEDKPDPCEVKINKGTRKKKMDNDVQVVDERELAFRTKFLFAVDHAIDLRMANKPKGEFFSYEDAHDVCSRVRMFFTKALGFVPPEVEGSCLIGETLVAPTMLDKIDLLKKAVAVLGPVAGIGMIIGGVGMILGWGAGVIAAITAYFTGISLTGPLALIFGGIGIATIATYFALKDDKSTYGAKFREIMRKSLADSIHLIWDRYASALSAAQYNIEAAK